MTAFIADAFGEGSRCVTDGSLSTEPLPVDGRRDSEFPIECAPEDVGVFVAHRPADGVYVHSARGQRKPATRFAQTCVGDELGRSHAEFFPERAREVPHAEKRSRSEFVDGEILVEIGVNPGAELLESVDAFDLESEWLGKLPLASRALIEHDHLARDREGRIGAEVVFDQREGEVDARRYAGGRVVLARLDVDRIGVDVEPWKSPFDVGDRSPVRRDLVAVKKAGGRESVQTGAYTAIRRMRGSFARIQVAALSATPGLRSPAPPGTMSVSNSI
jgi:hypothetical protein